MDDSNKVVDTYELIKNYIIKTPLIKSKDNCNVYLKLENLQQTGSFKERGVLSHLLRLTDDQKTLGIAGASAGNHSQALAYHADKLGIKCKLFVPKTTSLAKIDSPKKYNAEIELVGDPYDCTKCAKESNMYFVHPHDSMLTILGQGTVACEIMEQRPTTDCIVVPVGGGGLIAGIILYIKNRYPHVKIIAVESDKCPSLSYSIDNGSPYYVNCYPSLADGITVPQIGELPFNIIKDKIDDCVLVSDAQIAQALLSILNNDKVVLEGSGAVAFAAIQNNLSPIFNECKNIVCLCSGGNIDGSILIKIIDRGLKASGKIARLCVMMKDNPGNLAAVLTIIGNLRANIRNIIHEKTFQNNDTPLGIVKTFVEIETINFDHINEIINCLQKSPTVLSISI